MYTPRTAVKNVCVGFSNLCFPIQNFCSKSPSIKLDRAVIFSKLSRYEFERRKFKKLGDKELEKYLRKRGTDFVKLVHHHDLHKKFEEKVSECMNEMGIAVDIVNRFDCQDIHIENADVIVPIGGDGTFLSAASRVLDNKKPVVGFNSDPNRSEGYLCLPKYYSTNVRQAFEKLQKGEFAWLMRSRIRTTLIVNEEKNLIPKYLHDTDEDYHKQIEECMRKLNEEKEDRYKILPCLALNEVFIGETLSARVSHLEMRLDGSSRSTNLKCSGICISTGTGSTSWHISINRLPVQSVAELLKLLDIESNEDNSSVASTLADTYNSNLVFAPDDKRMQYTIRDLISAGVWPKPKGIRPRDFAGKIEIKSNCFDASLVIDGGVSFTFNDGSIALLEVLPEYALRTVLLHGSKQC